MSGNLIPQRMSRADLETVLIDMAARVRAGDSWEGYIAWAIPEDADGGSDVDVAATYRIGNSDGSQGGMRIIGTVPPSNLTMNAEH